MLVRRFSELIPEAPGNPGDFDGVVSFRVAHRAHDDSTSDVLLVTFEPGARTRPHIHSTVQVLYVVEGEGVVATRTGRWLVRPGDVAVVPAGEWHWHGATPASRMSHLAVKPPGPTDWSPPLLDWDTYMAGVRTDDGSG
jgi:quercetin dioxygenase-like cupin family protein